MGADLEGVALAKIDATIHSEVAKKYGVRGYPTLKWFKKDPENALEYGGGRKEAEIVSWVKKKTGPAAVELADVDAAKIIKDDNEVVVVGYFAEASKDDFIAVADKFDEGLNKYESGDLAEFVKTNSLAPLPNFLIKPP